MEKILTVEELDNSQPWIIRQWTFNNSYDLPDDPIMFNFVAVRWIIHDWAIYISPDNMTFDQTMRYWNKVRDKETIIQLVPCTDEAFELYRIN